MARTRLNDFEGLLGIFYAGMSPFLKLEDKQML
jgi:hypothetical protein